MAGTKQFRKRNAILEYLRSTDEHPSADMVFARLRPEYPDLSLGTVYRNLAMFKLQGTISSLGTVKGIERFDADIHPHVHFICTDCQKVLDLPQVQVPAELSQAVEAQAGGQVSECNLSFTGICSDCLKRQMEGGETA